MKIFNLHQQLHLHRLIAMAPTQVKKGDTLTAVAKKYGMTMVAELKKLNNLKTDALKVGQVLKVKSASAPSPAPAPQTSASAKQQQIV